MTEDVQLLDIVKRRFEVTGTLSYLHSRQLHHQQVRGGLEIERAQLHESMGQHDPSAMSSPALMEVETRLAGSEAALRACREDIAAREAELDEIDRHIGQINTQIMEA